MECGKVQNMNTMFTKAKNFNVNISNWDVQTVIQCEVCFLRQLSLIKILELECI